MVEQGRNDQNYDIRSIRRATRLWYDYNYDMFIFLATSNRVVASHVAVGGADHDVVVYVTTTTWPLALGNQLPLPKL